MARRKKKILRGFKFDSRPNKQCDELSSIVITLSLLNVAYCPFKLDNHSVTGGEQRERRFNHFHIRPVLIVIPLGGLSQRRSHNTNRQRRSSDALIAAAVSDRTPPKG